MAKIIRVERCGFCPHFDWWKRACKMAERYLDNEVHAYTISEPLPDWCPLEDEPKTSADTAMYRQIASEVADFLCRQERDYEALGIVVASIFEEMLKKEAPNGKA